MNKKIYDTLADMVTDCMVAIQDELSITDGAEPFDSRIDELTRELADEITRAIKHQLALKEMEENK